MADIKSETIALGALFQCCTQIQRIASTGYYDEKAVSCVLRALAVTDPKSVEDIYNPEYLTVGFKQIIDSLGKTDLAKDLLEKYPPLKGEQGFEGSRFCLQDIFG